MKAGAGSERGFTLIEMLVAMLLLSLVGLTLARFQTFQLAGTGALAAAAMARLEADNRAIDMMVQPLAPTGSEQGVSMNGGRQWHWRVVPSAAPDQALMPDMVAIEIAISATADGPAIATRRILRPRALPR